MENTESEETIKDEEETKTDEDNESEPSDVFLESQKDGGMAWTFAGP